MKLSLSADYISKLNFNYLKLSNFSQTLNLINLGIFDLILTCSAILKQALYADYFSKIIFNFFKLSQILNLINLLNFCLNFIKLRSQACQYFTAVLELHKQVLLLI